MQTSVGLIVPVLNAERHLDAFLASLQQQSIKPTAFLAIDSSSDDATVERLREFGAEVRVIPRADFNHGTTRQRALLQAPPVDVVVFVTQDVIFADPTSLEKLVESFSDPTVGAAYGRQLPRPGATPIESHSREFNYPAEGHVRSQSDVPHYGFRTAFLSNAFAAYRRSALMSVGGFPEGVIFGEDSVAASRLILAGWKISYRADAQVYHSHGYSIAEEFRRYFDIGVFHHRTKWIRADFGGATGEGMRFVRSELRYLWTTHPTLIPSAIARTFTKFAGYRLGRAERWLPRKVKRSLSMYRAFWTSRSSNGGMAGSQVLHTPAPGAHAERMNVA